MRKTMVIPTYWSRRSGEPWQEGDAIYDHPTPVDQEGTLERTLVSMKRFREKDFKLVILVCPTTEDVEEAALAQVRRIVLRSGLGAETYLFTAGDLREIAGILRGAGLDVYPDGPHIPPRLIALPQVVLTPHIGTNTQETRRRMAEGCARQIADALAGKRPEHVVNGIE